MKVLLKKGFQAELSVVAVSSLDRLDLVGRE